MTEFTIDLLHPGQFARTRADWFVGRQGRRRLSVAYALVALFVLVLAVAYYYYLGRFAAQRAILQAERQRLAALQAQVANRQQEVMQQRGLVPDLSALETMQVAWAAVLQALSERIPKDHWLTRIELVQPEAKPGPQPVPGAAPAAKPSPLLRLEVATALKPGSAPVLDVARFLDDLKQDPRFASAFQLQDWEALPDVVGAGEQRQQRLILSVRFKKLP